MMRHSWSVLFLALVVAPLAHAADQTVLGASLQVKNPSTADKRKITIKAKEVGTDDTVVGNPLANGASVTITLSGGTPSLQTFTMPAGLSPTTAKPFWRGDVLHGFTYADRKGDNGPVRKAQIKRTNGVFRLSVTIDGARGPVSLLPPNPGTAGCMLFTVAGGDSYSVQFATGAITNRGGLEFKITNPTAEGTCVTTTTTTTSSTTTTTLTPWPDIVPPGAAPLRYRDLVFSTVTKTADVTYGSAVNGSGQTITLRLDVYQPVGDTVTQRPAIIWVHGGSFSSGDKTSAELVDEANTFAKKGYVNLSINYRLEPGGCSSGGATATCILAIQEAEQDAQAAVRFLRANAATYGVDTDRIAIGGTSAGAITALNVGFARTEDPTATVAAVVSLSGANILSTIGAGDAPSLLFHGTADTVVPYAWGVSTYNQALAAGLDSYLTSWPGAGHVPYVQNRTQILDQTTNFLYWEMDLTNAAH